MAEWSKAHAWKVCMGQKLIVGSNPTRSASAARPVRVAMMDRCEAENSPGPESEAASLPQTGKAQSHPLRHLAAFCAKHSAGAATKFPAIH